MAHASDLKKGSSFIHQNTAYRVTKKENVTVGTHSHTKLKVFAKPILEAGGEKSFIYAHADRVEMVDLIRKSAQVLSKTDENVQIMDSVSYETFDADIDKALLEELNEGDNVIFVNLNSMVKVLERTN